MDENLIKAAELIENNFGRHSFQSDGKLCLVGAIAVSQFNMNLNSYSIGNLVVQRFFDKEVDKVAKVIPLISGCEGCNDGRTGHAKVYHYNDDHCQGGVEAAKILREAAEVD